MKRGILEELKEHTDWVNSYVIVEKDTGNHHSPNHTVKKKLRIYVVPQRSWGDRSDTDHSKCLLLGGRRLNLLTVIPKPKGSGGARAATAQIGPANERNKTK